LFTDGDSLVNSEEENEANFNSISKTRKSTIRMRIYYCIRICEKQAAIKEQKIEYIKKILNSIQTIPDSDEKNDTIDSILNEYKQWNDQSKVSIEDIVKECIDENVHEKYSVRTVLDWYNDYKNEGLSAWSTCNRGKYERKNRFKDIVIDGETVEKKFEYFLNNEEAYTVETCCHWLTKLLEDNFPEGDVRRNIEVNSSFVFRWMKKLGTNNS